MAVTAGRVRDDRGAAVAVALALVAVLVLVAAVSVGTVVIVLSHRRAQAAADLASLAGAAALQRGGDACAAASRIAERHDAVLARCLVEGPTVLVVTTVALPAALTRADVSARARAGPATAAGAAQGAGPRPSAPR